MRIAVSTQDGLTICGHLGRCKSFIIYEVDGGSVSGKGLVDIGGLCPGHEAHGHGGGHNVGPFDGCLAVITQGMGQGMLNALMGAGIAPVITALSDPDEAVERFLRGDIGSTAVSSCGCDKH